MFWFWCSAGMVVGSVVAYHLCQKSMPRNANPMLSLMVAFITAIAASALILPLFLRGTGLVAEFGKLSWASVVLGITMLGVDVGYLMLYRSGWDLSLGSVFCNALVTLILVPVGVFVFKEKLALTNYLGIALTVAGIYLITRR